MPFLRTLQCLRDLSIARSTRLAELLLSPQISEHPFPSLSTLELDASFSNWPNPFDPPHFARLYAFSSLQSFTLMVARDLNTIHEKQELEVVEEVDSQVGVRISNSAQSGPWGCNNRETRDDSGVQFLILAGLSNIPSLLRSSKLRRSPSPSTSSPNIPHLP